MAANNTQKIAVLNNDAALLATLQNYLTLGYVIHQMINLTPFATKVMIIYYDPAII
jgi:hypothetical protein